MSNKECLNPDYAYSEAFLKDIDAKKSTAKVLENGKIVIFPVIKNNLYPKTNTKTARKKINQAKRKEPEMITEKYPLPQGVFIYPVLSNQGN